MKILRDSADSYILKCSNCDGVFLYSLHDIHAPAVPHFNKSGKMIGMAGFDTVLCPCCETILSATKEPYYGDIQSNVKVVKEPNTTVECKKCKAVVTFSYDAVTLRKPISHRRSSYLAIDCPCCNSTIKVWEDENEFPEDLQSDPIASEIMK